MKDVQLLVLNNHQEPAGVGELGEIFVRSHHMRSVQAGGVSSHSLSWRGIRDQQYCLGMDGGFVWGVSKRPMLGLLAHWHACAGGTCGL